MNSGCGRGGRVQSARGGGGVRSPERERERERETNGPRKESCCGVNCTPTPNVPLLYRGTSLIRNTPPVGPYSSPMPRDLWLS